MFHLFDVLKICPFFYSLRLQMWVPTFWTWLRLWSHPAASNMSRSVQRLHRFSQMYFFLSLFLTSLPAVLFRQSLNWLRNRECGKGELLCCLQPPVKSFNGVFMSGKWLKTQINLHGTLTWEPLQPHRNLQPHCWNARRVSQISGPSALPPPAVWVPEALRCVCRVCLPRSGR